VRIKVLLFAALKERAGAAEFEVELPDGATVAEAARAVEQQRSGLTLKGAMAAVNEVYARADHRLGDGDVLAFIPPVTGGRGRRGPVTGGWGRRGPVAGGSGR
jgi:molybdopterin synthase catalytic subunit